MVPTRVIDGKRCVLTSKRDMYTIPMLVAPHTAQYRNTFMSDAEMNEHLDLIMAFKNQMVERGLWGKLVAAYQDLRERGVFPARKLPGGPPFDSCVLLADKYGLPPDVAANNMTSELVLTMHAEAVGRSRNAARAAAAAATSASTPASTSAATPAATSASTPAATPAPTPASKKRSTLGEDAESVRLAGLLRQWDERLIKGNLMHDFNRILIHMHINKKITPNMRVIDPELLRTPPYKLPAFVVDDRMFCFYVLHRYRTLLVWHMGTRGVSLPTDARMAVGAKRKASAVAGAPSVSVTVAPPVPVAEFGPVAKKANLFSDVDAARTLLLFRESA